MGVAALNNLYNSEAERKEVKIEEIKDLTSVEINKPYRIRKVVAKGEQMRNFLFTLGCFEGEKVTVISALPENYIVHIKDARYSIDKDLAKAIIVEPI